MLKFLTLLSRAYLNSLKKDPPKEPGYGGPFLYLYRCSACQGFTWWRKFPNEEDPFLCERFVLVNPDPRYSWRSKMFASVQKCGGLLERA